MIEIDNDTCSVIVNGDNVKLTNSELLLLRLLLSRQDSVVSKTEISSIVFDGSATDAAIEKLVSRLRNRIGYHRISTNRDQGYSLTIAPAPPLSDVYIMHIGYADLYKIGYGHAKSRLDTGRAFNPLLKLVAIGKSTEASKLEYFLHRMFRDYHVVGEIFRLDKTQYTLAVDTLNRMCYDDWVLDICSPDVSYKSGTVLYP